MDHVLGSGHVDVKGTFLCPCFSLQVVQIGLMMFVEVHDSFVVGQVNSFKEDFNSIIEFVWI
jgi:hypothetical protein